MKILLTWLAAPCAGLCLITACDEGDDDIVDTPDSGSAEEGDATVGTAAVEAGVARDADATATHDASVIEEPPDAEDAASYVAIRINEVQSKATEGYPSYDFVELYNASSGSFTFAAGAWRLTDSDASHTFSIPGGTTLAGGRYLVLLPDTEVLPDAGVPDGTLVCVQDGTNSEPFGLGSTDGVSLYFTGADDPETPVDATSWEAHVQARARVPDGGDWATTDDQIPTPGASNE